MSCLPKWQGQVLSDQSPKESACCSLLASLSLNVTVSILCCHPAVVLFYILLMTKTYSSFSSDKVSPQIVTLFKIGLFSQWWVLRTPPSPFSPSSLSSPLPTPFSSSSPAFFWRIFYWLCSKKAAEQEVSVISSAVKSLQSTYSRFKSLVSCVTGGASSHSVTCFSISVLIKEWRVLILVEYNVNFFLCGLWFWCWALVLIISA